MISPSVLAADARALPPLSQATFALIALMGKEETSAFQVEQAVRRDAALAANLLRTANSPWFGLGRKVTSLTHAINLIGFVRVHQLAMTMSLQASLPEALPGYGIARTDFVVHSIAVAFLAEHLGKRLELDAHVPYYVAGLLHDIGKLLLARHLQDRKTELVANLAHNLTLLDAERELLGTDHTEVAAVLGKAWNLPNEVIAAAVGHHDPSRYVEGPHSQLVDVVHVANITARALGYGQDVAGLARSPNPATFQRLGIRASSIEHVVSECVDTLAATCRAVVAEETTP
jgi:putative nucleotidyltransferase with HDIG domain